MDRPNHWRRARGAEPFVRPKTTWRVSSRAESWPRPEREGGERGRDERRRGGRRKVSEVKRARGKKKKKRNQLKLKKGGGGKLALSLRLTDCRRRRFEHGRGPPAQGQHSCPEGPAPARELGRVVQQQVGLFRHFPFFCCCCCSCRVVCFERKALHSLSLSLKKKSLSTQQTCSTTFSSPLRTWRLPRGRHFRCEISRQRAAAAATSAAAAG